MHSFYFAITTLTTVGYGDINATNSMEMAFLSVRSKVSEVITLPPPLLYMLGHGTATMRMAPIVPFHPTSFHHTTPLTRIPYSLCVRPTHSDLHTCFTPSPGYIFIPHSASFCFAPPAPHFFAPPVVLPTPCSHTPTLTPQVVLVFGAILYSIIMGTVSGIIMELNSGREGLMQRLNSLDTFIENNGGGLNMTLINKLRETIKYQWAISEDQLNGEGGVLSELPTHLQNEVAVALHGEYILRIPLFQQLETALIRTIVPRLSLQICIANCVIFRQGDVGGEMFIIRRGRFALRSSRSIRPLAVLEKDNHIGVISLLKAGLHRVASCWSLTRGEFYVLTREAFLAVLNDFPHMHEVIQEAALRELAVQMRRESLSAEGDSAARAAEGTGGGVTATKSPLVAMIGAVKIMGRWMPRPPAWLNEGSFIIVNIQSAKGLPRMDLAGLSDPYCKVSIGKRMVFRSTIVLQNLNPTWDETFVHHVPDDIRGADLDDLWMQFDLFDYDDFQVSRWLRWLLSLLPMT